jgi:hypothetical protein
VLPTGLVHPFGELARGASQGQQLGEPLGGLGSPAGFTSAWTSQNEQG